MSNDSTPELPPPSTQATVDIPARIVDMEGLKALAHPLRVKILDTLSTYGEFTASGLGERLGESSGATSYHLRQLEKHKFVREVQGRGTGRERWWERVPGGIMVGSPSEESTPSERAASKLVLREWMVNRRIVLDDFLNNGDDVLSQAWMEASVVSMSNLNLTREQASDLSTRLQGVLDEFVVAYRGQKVPGARPVQTHINVFPVIDGTQVPETTSKEVPS
ncbi:ArsR family transcriptional regulator [Glaciihabitans arcticus]|uniref:ArsR family transcriptional regulator n=1 Tax=Glaciihabitans arcticus TaxID=2668039 RepID=A0A4Q9GXR8_9MICO|nr:helix-turn-helix domain-containing protein [Glaciihabitans arcticus]TBN57070.1 ArsR family transcriptional regulator [Glaciihabitans arcticus]